MVPYKKEKVYKMNLSLSLLSYLDHKNKETVESANASPFFSGRRH